jgi:hypothetical protein
MPGNEYCVVPNTSLYLPILKSVVSDWIVNVGCSEPRDIEVGMKFLNVNVQVKVEGKAMPVQAWTGPEGSRRMRCQNFKNNRHMKLVRLAVLCTVCLNSPSRYTWYSFLL